MNFFHLLTLVFVAAKLFGHFPYSWWAAFLPSMFSIGVGLAILVLAGVAFVVKELR